MDGLIQTTTGVKLRLYRPIFWDSSGVRVDILEMVIAAIIFDVSRDTLFCNLTMVVYRDMDFPLS